MSGEGFLGRWSRRKRAAVEGRPPADDPARPPHPAPAAAGIAALPAAADPPRPDPDRPDPAAPDPARPGASERVAFDPATLPPVEELTAESDVTGFLREGVPAPLRNAAMRRAWSLDPVIRDYIGPADYAWDFNAPDTIPGFSATLGGDLAKLIAQATGHPLPPEPGPDPEGEALADAAPAPAPALASADGEAVAADGGAVVAAEPTAPEAPLPVSALRRTDPAAPDAALPRVIVPTHARVAVLAAPPEVSAPAPRRHGGAIPI